MRARQHLPKYRAGAESVLADIAVIAGGLVAPMHAAPANQVAGSTDQRPGWVVGGEPARSAGSGEINGSARS